MRLLLEDSAQMLSFFRLGNNIMPIPNRVCQQCGKEFYTPPSNIKRGYGRFCTKKCKGKWQSKYCVGKNSAGWRYGRTKCSCKLCGKEFSVKKSVIKNGGGKFCSKKCYGKWNSINRAGKNSPFWAGGKLKRLCKNCGKEFEKYRGIFCSVACRHKGMSGKNSPTWNGGEVKCKCKNCGKVFSLMPSLLKSGQGVFCSRKCMGEWNSKYRIGENSYNWLGGKSFEPYGIEFNKKLKEQIRKRDNYTCQECGIKQTELKTKLSIHHIDYDKKNNNPNNLIALCTSCHMKTNYKRKQWTKYFNNKLEK